MAAWPKQRKQETRRRIVAAAAEAFRQRGIESVGVDEIMGRAGLTIFDVPAGAEKLEAPEALRKSPAPASSAKSGAAEPGIMDVAKFYLSTQHYARPEHGCPVAALGTELSRSTGGTRRTVAAELRGRIKKLFARTSPSLSPELWRVWWAG
jgi:TetR/AcrR family transcriptional repressor of nem operon